MICAPSRQTARQAGFAETVEPLNQVRPDWPVVEIEDANHLSCVVREQFREELAAWLDKNLGQGKADKRVDLSMPAR